MEAIYSLVHAVHFRRFCAGVFMQMHEVEMPDVRPHLKREQSLETPRHRDGHRVPHRPGFGREGRGEARSDAAALSLRIGGLLHRLAVTKSCLKEIDGRTIMTARRSEAIERASVPTG